MKPSLEELFWRSEMPMVQILSDMEHIGVNCDVNTAMRMELKCHKLLSTYDDYWEDKVRKPHGISWSSPKQLLALFKSQGLPIQKKVRIDAKTKQRKYTECIDEDVLELYRDSYKSKLAGLVLFMRKLKKAADFTHIYSADGRAHARYMDQRGGRIQAKEPDLQNIPEELEAAGVTVLPRTIIIPDDPETGCIISGDFEALEFYLYGYACQDEAILNARKKGIYIYGIFYKDIFHKSFFEEGAEPKKWNRRKDIQPWELLVAKSGPLGMLYGRNVASLEKGFGIAKSRAMEIYNGFHREHPGVRPHHTELLYEAARVGYLKNFFGRIRRFPNARMSQNEIMSFTGQSNGADVLRTSALIPLSQGLRNFGARLMLTVHDSVVVSCPEKSLHGCTDFVRECMESPLQALDNFWIPATLKVCTRATSSTGIANWGDAIDYETYCAQFGYR